MLSINSGSFYSKLAKKIDQIFMTVVLEYINRFIACMNIILVISHYAAISA